METKPKPPINPFWAMFIFVFTWSLFTICSAFIESVWLGGKISIWFFAGFWFIFFIFIREFDEIFRDLIGGLYMSFLIASLFLKLFFFMKMIDLPILPL